MSPLAPVDRSEERFEVWNQGGQLNLGDPPDYIELHAKVVMDDDVSRASNLSPGNVRRKGSDLRRHRLSSLPDCLNGMNYRQAKHLVSFEIFFDLPVGKLHGQSGVMQHVGYEEPLTGSQLDGHRFWQNSRPQLRPKCLSLDEFHPKTEGILQIQIEGCEIEKRKLTATELHENVEIASLLMIPPRPGTKDPQLRNTILRREARLHVLQDCNDLVKLRHGFIVTRPRQVDARAR
jgi:hypothetical protein